MYERESDNSHSSLWHCHALQKLCISYGCVRVRWFRDFLDLHLVLEARPFLSPQTFAYDLICRSFYLTIILPNFILFCCQYLLVIVILYYLVYSVVHVVYLGKQVLGNFMFEYWSWPSRYCAAIGSCLSLIKCDPHILEGAKILRILYLFFTNNLIFAVL